LSCSFGFAIVRRRGPTGNQLDPAVRASVHAGGVT